MTQQLTLSQAEDAVWDAVAACMDADQNAQSLIRKSWPTGTESGTLPDWNRLENYCFLRMVRVPEEQYGLARHISYRVENERLIRQTCYTAVWSAQLIFSGPASMENAEKTRLGLFAPAVRVGLRASRLYPVTTAQQPLRGPELFENQWWERDDITVLFYESVCLETEEAYFASAPVRLRT